MVDPMFIQSDSNIFFLCVWGRDNELIERWLRIFVSELGHNDWRQLQGFIWTNDNFTCKMMTIYPFRTVLMKDWELCQHIHLLCTYRISEAFTIALQGE